jgi:hypothetical protein
VSFLEHPHTRPSQTKKSPAPACHAASKEARTKFREDYSAFVAAFREAAEKLKKGEWPVRFPMGSFWHVAGFATFGNRFNPLFLAFLGKDPTYR